MEIRFELRDCRPSGRRSAKRTTLRRIAPFVRCGSSDVPTRSVIIFRFSMGTPNTWRDYSLISAALERTELMVRCANIIRAFLYHIIRSSGTRRLSPSGRWPEMRPALSQLVHSPPSIQFVPLRVR
jgi:hypothetical protein